MSVWDSHASRPPSSVAGDVARLFRTRRVSEIRTIEGDIRRHVAEQTTSLQSLLGTRSSALLGAAGTVSELRDRARDDLLGSARGLSEAAGTLRERLVAQAAPASPQHPEREHRRVTRSVGAKLKLLVDSPEALYGLLDAARVYDAAVRYLSAQAAHSFLVGRPEASLFAKFADQRLGLVTNFRSQIVESAGRALCARGLSQEEYGGAVVAAALMDGRVDAAENRDDFESVPAAFEKLLVSRTKQVEDLIASDSTDASLVKRVQEILQVLVSTLHLAVELFRENGIVHRLVAGVGPKAEYLKVPSFASLTESVVSWLAVIKLKTMPSSDGENVLSQAQTCATLAKILERIDETILPAPWGKTVEETRAAEAEGEMLKEGPLLVTPSAIRVIFIPAITAQAVSLTKRTIKDCTGGFLEGMKRIQEPESAGRSSGAGEADVSVDELEVLKDLNMGEDLEREGFDKRAATVMKKFNEALSFLLNDIAELSQSIPNTASTVRDEVADAVGKIIPLFTIHGNLSPASALCVAQVASGLATSETLRKAFHFQAGSCVAESEDGSLNPHAIGGEPEEPGSGSPSSKDSGDTRAESLEYDRAVERFTSAAAANYAAWAEGTVKSLKGELKDSVGGDLMKVRHGWDHDEKSGAVHVPAGGSAAAMSFVIRCCSAVGKTDRFDDSKPWPAAMAMAAAMCDAFCEVYKEVILEKYGGEASEGQTRGDEGSREKATGLTQMLFDVLMMRTGLMEVEDKAFVGDGGHEGGTRQTRRGKFDELERMLYGSLDPVDLAAGKKRLFKNVEVFLERSALLFGVIGKGSREIQGNSDTSGETILLREVVPRFAYLPAPLPSTYMGKVVVPPWERRPKQEVKTAEEKPSDVETVAQRLTEGIFGSKFLQSLTRVGQS